MHHWQKIFGLRIVFDIKILYRNHVQSHPPGIRVTVAESWSVTVQWAFSEFKGAILMHLLCCSKCILLIYWNNYILIYTAFLKHFFGDTYVMLHCCYAFVLPILEYCSSVWGSAAEWHFQLLKWKVYLVARFCPDQTFLSLYHRRHVAALCMLYEVNSNSNHCLFSELPSASVRVWHTQSVAAAHPFEFEVSRCRTSQL